MFLSALLRSPRRLALAALMSAAVVMVPCVARAQQAPGVGEIAGSVMDPDAKAVVDAAVLVRGETTGEVHATATDGRGRFSVPGLAPGVYTVEVAVPGFDIVRQIMVRVDAGKADDLTFQLTVANITETVTVSAALPGAAVAAPSQGSLTARSAQSLISNEYIRSYTSPVSDYSQVLQMAPGTFSVSANGPGLSDTKTFFRGFKDGQYSMTFDGIPFNDTNDPTHHSWVFFPAQTIGSTVFERSPGSAASIGPSTYGGSVNMLSQSMPSRPQIAGTVSYGSFNTKLLGVQYDSGALGGSGKSRFLIEGHRTDSDGYQTYNSITINAASAKYQYNASANTVISAFTTLEDMQSHTPNQKGATRAQIAQFGDNFLMSGDPASPLYYGYNFYHVPTNFEYLSIRTNLGRGWSIEEKPYAMRYYNHQNFNSTSAISATSGTDKLNSYWKFGNLVPVSYVSNRGIFRTGLWTEYASTDRYQTPSDPRTWVNAALPNFHEQFGTTTVQPYAEYQLKATSTLSITPGIKYTSYKQDFRQFADNGKIVGNLGGAAYIDHAATYNAWLPSIDAHYIVQNYWSVYGQYGKGQNAPPKPTTTDTVQFGSVWKSSRATLDMDVFRIRYDNDYSSSTDALTGDTATCGMTCNRQRWNLGFFNKRVGRLVNDNGAVHEAFVVDPFNITNLFVNYSLRGTSMLSQSRLRLAVNNLADSHALTGAPKGGTASSTSRALSAATFPRDGGVRAGARIGGIDFVAEGGEATNRQDETRLSFHVAALDAATRVLTVRECLWNRPSSPWGASTTIALSPRPRTTGTTD